MASNTDVKNVARGLIGTVEDPAGSNHNFITDFYAALVNNPGFAHAAWCAESETYEVHHVEPSVDWFVYAYVPYIERDARAGVNGLSWSDSPPADVEENCVLAILDFAGHGYGTHTGLREVELGDGTRYLLEGNIGDAFRREHRDNKYVRGYVIVPLDGVPQPVPDPGPGNSPAAVGRVELPNLRRGSRGRAVKFVEVLTSAPLDSGVGIFGPQCDSQVRKFQTDHGLTVDGQPGPQTWTAMLQAGLNWDAHAGLTIDGDFGPATTAAVIDFQRDHGLSIDGIAGYETFGAITGQ